MVKIITDKQKETTILITWLNSGQLGISSLTGDYVMGCAIGGISNSEIIHGINLETGDFITDGSVRVKPLPEQTRLVIEA